MFKRHDDATPIAEWVAFAGGLILLGWFQLETWPVRFANVDDVDCYRVTRSGDILQYIAGMSQSQSRFFQLWNLGLVELLNQISSPFWFGLHRTVLLGAEFALGGWLLARLGGAASYGWLFWVVGLGTLQLPPGFYPVLSYPPIAFGLVALLTAAVAYDHALTDGKPALLTGAAVCFFASMLFHDTFAIYALVFPLILLARRPQQFRASLPTLAPLAVAFALYVAIYVGYRWTTTAEHTYDGTTPSFAPGPALRTWIRYTFSVAPGFELWIVRDGELGAPLFHRLSSVVAGIRAEFSVAILFKTALVAFCAGLLLHRPHRAPTGGLTFKLAAAASLLAALACVPIAFSEKYQAWALQRQMPYAYSFFAVFFGWAAVSALLISGVGVRPGRRHTVVQVLAVVLVAYAAFCANLTNPRILRQLAHAYNEPAPVAVARPP